MWFNFAGVHVCFSGLHSRFFIMLSISPGFILRSNIHLGILIPVYRFRVLGQWRNQMREGEGGRQNLLVFLNWVLCWYINPQTIVSPTLIILDTPLSLGLGSPNKVQSPNLYGVSSMMLCWYPLYWILYCNCNVVSWPPLYGLWFIDWVDSMIVVNYNVLWI